ncbi:MAG: ABC transporter permease [Armatimonadota bacterium]
MVSETLQATSVRRPGGSREERVFGAVIAGALGFELAFILAVIAALVLFTDRHSLIKALMTPDAQFSIRLTLITVTISSGISVLLAIPAAYGLTFHRIPARAVVDTLLDLPIVMPPIAAGLALLLLFGYYLGDPMRAHAMYLPYTQAGVVVAQFFATMTFAVRTSKAAFESVGPRLPAVAASLGSNNWRVFKRIILPLSKPGLVAGAVLTWARCVGLFGPVIMFCGVTRYRTEILPTSIYLNNSVGQLEVAAAGTLILLLIALVALIVMKRLGGRGYLW